MKLYPSSLHRQEASEADAQPFVEMNTTPLIDVMLVLLVMLIITIPVQLHSVQLDMPSASSNAEPELVRLHIDAAGFVRWNDQVISDVGTLDARLREAAATRPQPEIHISPQPDTPYELVVSMTALAQKMGLRQVGVVN